MKKITLLLVCLAANVLVFGQWTDDTTLNTLVGGEKPQDNHTVAGSNGNTYTVFWNHTTDTLNYELRLQILDPMGVKQFGPAGAVISTTIPMSSFTQVFSLNIDADNNLYVGLTATTGNIGYIFKLDSEGNNLWTSDGISLGVGYVVRITPLSSGDVIVSWMDDSSAGNIQKFDSNGNAVWTEPVVMPSFVPAQTFELADGNTVTIFHKKLSFGINSVDYAQRFDADGVAQWSEPLQLFESSFNTVFNTNYSAYQQGDVIYYSYKLSHNSRFDAYLQRINPDGTLPWGITGVDFDTNQTNYEQEIQIAASPTSDYIWGICRYTDSAQGHVGVYAQKFDKETGDRMLSDNAKEIYPLTEGPTSMNAAGTVRMYNDQPVFLTADGSFALGNHIYINMLDSAGNFAWSEQSLPMATFDAVKSRIELVKISDNEFVTTFLDDKGNGDHIFAQHFQNGPLGVQNIVANQNITFPNPVTDKLELNCDKPITSVSIYTIEGQLIYQSANNQTNNLVLDASSWTSGMYLGIVATDDGIFQSIKILKL